MKIGIILRVLWPAGAPRIAIEQVKRLSARGHNCKLIIYRESDYKFRYEEFLNDIDVKFVTRGITSRISEIINSFTLPFLPSFRGKESIVDVTTIILYPLLISKKSYDVILCHDQFAGISGYLLKKIKGIPYVVYVHERPLCIGYSPKNACVNKIKKWFNNIEKKVFENADCVIASTDAIYEDLIKLFKIKATILYPGCNPTVTPFLNRRNFVLALSRWDAPRNPYFLFDIAKKNKSLKFIIAGSWTPKSFEEEYRKNMNKQEIKNIEIRSNIPEKDLQELYKTAAVSIRWGINEFGTSMSTLESISHGCPVIVNKELGGARLITHGVDGFVVDGLDSDEYVKYIRLLLDKEDIAKEMRINAWNLAKSLSWENHVKRLDEIINNITKRR